MIRSTLKWFRRLGWFVRESFRRNQCDHIMGHTEYVGDHALINSGQQVLSGYSWRQILAVPKTEGVELCAFTFCPLCGERLLKRGWRLPSIGQIEMSLALRKLVQSKS